MPSERFSQNRLVQRVILDAGAHLRNLPMVGKQLAWFADVKTRMLFHT